MARTLFLIILVVTLSSLSISISPAGAQDALSSEQMAKVREELLTSLSARPRAELEARGWIMPGERIEDAMLGQPLAYYRIDTEQIQKLTDHNLFKQCLVFCLWDIPISFGGRPRFLFGVYSKDGEWHLARYGGDPAFIEDARSRWPKSKGYSLSYLMGTRGLDFIMVEKGDRIGLCSFREGNDKVLGIKKDHFGRDPLLDVPSVVKKLKAIESRSVPKTD